MTALELWLIANRNLTAKSIGELSYEQLLKPIKESEHGYRLNLASGVSYTFSAWSGVWGHLRVDPNSIRRLHNGLELPVTEAGKFFIDSQVEHGMNDIVLGNFLEEMHNTLYADMALLKKTAHLSVNELSDMNGNELQSVLNGHPKILLNKGRMGWGADDLARYAPESAEPFQLYWLALFKEKTTQGSVNRYEGVMDPSWIEKFRSIVCEQGKCDKDYVFVPVHPWQWSQIIQIQFAGEIASGEIIPLGFHGDFYQPQISIRTLSNVSNPNQPDVKLSLSILNTSAIRGIPERYVRMSPQVSKTVAMLCKTDSVLLAANTDVLEEKAGISFKHPIFSEVKGAPYRYHETLGVIWRESVGAKLAHGELGILTGSLFHQDQKGKSLIGAYIQRSGLETQEWLRRYFNVVVIPLYHLQLKYGLGLVAHGQNIVLKLKNFAPHGMFLKDFQGDLRLSTEHVLDSSLAQVFSDLDRLPPEHLIHDLLTGHFLTVLRFISAALQESEGFSEREFYAILAGCIRNHLETYGEGQTDQRVSLLNEKVHRVLLNKVRFQIGYADSAERPRPLLGSDLLNPLTGGLNG